MNPLIIGSTPHPIAFLGALADAARKAKASTCAGSQTDPKCLTGPLVLESTPPDVRGSFLDELLAGHLEPTYVRPGRMFKKSSSSEAEKMNIPMPKAFAVLEEGAKELESEVHVTLNPAGYHMAPEDRRKMEQEVARLHRQCHGKRRYACKKDAITAAAGAMKRRRNRPKMLRAYPCPICRGWHLTKKEKR